MNEGKKTENLWEQVEDMCLKEAVKSGSDFLMNIEIDCRRSADAGGDKYQAERILRMAKQLFFG